MEIKLLDVIKTRYEELALIICYRKKIKLGLISKLNVYCLYIPLKKFVYLSYLSLYRDIVPMFVVSGKKSHLEL